MTTNEIYPGAAFMSRMVDRWKEVGDSEFLKILIQAEMNFGEKILVDYAKSYQENPKAWIGCFIKYDSIKMACVYAIDYSRRTGISKAELKDFSEWVEKQKIEDKWKPVLNKFLGVLHLILSPTDKIKMDG